MSRPIYQTLEREARPDWSVVVFLCRLITSWFMFWLLYPHFARNGLHGAVRARYVNILCEYGSLLMAYAMENRGSGANEIHWRVELPSGVAPGYRLLGTVVRSYGSDCRRIANVLLCGLRM